jgi:hypothetical protein
MESSPAVALLADNDHSCLLCILTSQIKEFSFVNLDAKCNLLVAPRGFFFSWINQTTAKEEDKILSRADLWELQSRPILLEHSRDVPFLLHAPSATPETHPYVVRASGTLGSIQVMMNRNGKQ